MALTTVRPEGMGFNTGRRNLIINGAMQVAQRGSSHTTEGYGSLDRYYLALSGASGVTMSQQAFSTADRNSLGFEKYLKLVVTTANNNCGVYQYIEASNAVGLIGKKATLSFYAKGTNPAGGSFTMQPAWYNTSSGGGDNAVAQSLTVTSSWVKYSFTFDIPAPANTTIDNSAYLSIPFIQPAGDTSTTAWELNLAGLQVELGSNASDFEHRSVGEELSLCQRYYTEIQKASGQAINTSQTILCGVFPTEMRATPTASLSAALTIWQLGIVGSKGQSSSNISVNSNINSASVFNAECGNFSSLTLHTATAVAGGDQPLKFDAEL
jgi:hypothetical protein